MKRSAAVLCMNEYVCRQISGWISERVKAVKLGTGSVVLWCGLPARC